MGLVLCANRINAIAVNSRMVQQSGVIALNEFVLFTGSRIPWLFILISRTPDCFSHDPGS
jgi:hypothetical protein